MKPTIWLQSGEQIWVEVATDNKGTLNVSRIAARANLRVETLLLGDLGAAEDTAIEDVRSVNGLSAGQSKSSAVLVGGIAKISGTPTYDQTLSIRKSIVEQRIRLCNVDALQGLLKTELEAGLRFPVTKNYWDSLPTENRGKLFKLAGPYEGCDEIVPLVLAILKPPMPAPTADTEGSFHHFWDTVIEDPLKFFFDGPWLAERNKSGEGSISGTRPDKVVRFGFRFYALWRGEEKGPVSAGDPRQELILKLDWTYKRLPFLMAYYARATMVTFCALHVVGDPYEKRCSDLIRFDVSTAKGRLELVLSCITVARLLKTMEYVCEGHDEVSDMPLIRRNSGKIVRPFGRKVEKTYPIEALYKKVTAIYSATLSCPNVERLLHTRDSDQTIVVQRAVVGKPDNNDDLIACIRCLCEALQWLHGKGLMHRDIRWENVLRDMDNAGKWVLVDLDEVLRRDECFELHPLDASSHAPEMIVGPHDTMVDIWGIGHLLHTSNVLLDSKLTDLMERCLRPVPDQRPTAAECLKLLDITEEEMPTGPAEEAHPEVIGESGIATEEVYQKDLAYLKEKCDAGAEVIVTQLFYDTDGYLKFVNDCRQIGIKVPVVPGIMPIQNYKGFLRMTSLCKTKVPAEIMAALEPIKDNEEAVRAYGIHLGTEMCKKILAHGIKTLHLYSLNLEKSVLAILQNLGLIDFTKVTRSLPWRPPTNSKRTKEDVRPIFWANRPRSYISRTTSWDEFPRGRWGDTGSPAYGSLSDHQFLRKKTRGKKLQKEWAVPLKSAEDVIGIFTKYCQGGLSTHPWSELEGLQPETVQINEKLVALNSKGFLTINSQPAVNGEKSDSSSVGWGGPGGFVYQKAYVEFFCSPEKLQAVIEKAQTNSSLTYIAVNAKGETQSNVGPTSVNAVTWGVFPAKEVIQPTVVDPVSFMVWKDEAFQAWDQEWASLYPEDDASRKILSEIKSSYFLVSMVDNDYISGDLFSVFA